MSCLGSTPRIFIGQSCIGRSGSAVPFRTNQVAPVRSAPLKLIELPIGRQCSTAVTCYAAGFYIGQSCIGQGRTGQGCRFQSGSHVVQHQSVANWSELHAAHIGQVRTVRVAPLRVALVRVALVQVCTDQGCNAQVRTGQVRHPHPPHYQSGSPH